jgi:hypothetical protein
MRGMVGTLAHSARTLGDGLPNDDAAAVSAMAESRPYLGVDELGWDLQSLDPLRRAFELGGGPARVSDRTLRDALRPMCLAGQRAGKHAEDMVILLKTVWPTIARSATASSRRSDTDFERVVSIGIEEYYRAIPLAQE